MRLHGLPRAEATRRARELLDEPFNGLAPLAVASLSETLRQRAKASRIVLYGALTFAGTLIATIVAMEKSTRISEVLLAVLRPSQIVVGTVVAVGVATLGQLLVLAIPLEIAVRVTDSIGLSPVATVDLALGVVWFVLGYALYAFPFGAAAALVNKVTEVNTAVMPLTLLRVGSAIYRRALLITGRRVRLRELVGA